MKTVTLHDGTAHEALEVFGGKEQYQNARREYLEFVVPQEGNTVEALEAAFSGEHCESLTITDPQTEAQFIHEGYVLRGPVRVFCEEDGTWKIAIRRYQRTEMEVEVAALRETVAGLVEARKAEKA